MAAREPRAKYCLVCDCKVERQRTDGVRERTKILQIFLDCMSVNKENFKGDLNAANCFCVKCSISLKEWDSGRELILQIRARGEQLKATMAMSVLNTQRVRTKGRTRSTATEKLRNLIRQQYNVRVKLARVSVGEESVERTTAEVRQVVVPDSRNKGGDGGEETDPRPRKRLRSESLPGIEKNLSLGLSALDVGVGIDCTSSKNSDGVPVRTESSDSSARSTEAEEDCLDDEPKHTEDETSYPDIRIVNLSTICISDEEPMETYADKSSDLPSISQDAAVDLLNECSLSITDESHQIPTWVREPIQCSAVGGSSTTKNVTKNTNGVLNGVTQVQARSQLSAFKPQFADPNVVQTGLGTFSYANLVPFFLAEGRYICGICPAAASSLMITNFEILSHIRTKHGHILPKSIFSDFRSSLQAASSTAVTAVSYMQGRQGSPSTETSSSNTASPETSHIPPVTHKEIQEISPGHYSYYGRPFTYSDGKYFCGLCSKYWFAVIGAVDLITLHMRTLHGNLLTVPGQAQPKIQGNLRVVKLLRPEDVELLKSKRHRIIGSRILSQPQQVSVPSAPSKLLVSDSLAAKETHSMQADEFAKSKHQQEPASVYVTTTTRNPSEGSAESPDEIQIVDENREVEEAAKLPTNSGTSSNQFECVFCHKRFDNTAMFFIHVQTHQIIRQVV